MPPLAGLAAVVSRYCATPVETTRLTGVPPLTSVPAEGLSLITLPEGTVVLDAVVTVPSVRPAAVMADVAAVCVVPTTLGTAIALTLKVVLGVARLIAALFGFSVREAMRESPVAGPENVRPLKVATPAAVVAVAGDVVRSELASVTLTLAEPVVSGVPLSVTVTAGAGAMVVPEIVPVAGGLAVNLIA